MDLITLKKPIINRIKGYLDQIDILAEQFTLAGIEVFNKQKNSPFDVFLSGKVFNAATYVIAQSTGQEKEKYTKILKNMMPLLLDLPVATWGILYFFIGLDRLKKCGEYDQVIDKQYQQLLQEKLDYKTFVRDDLSLINKPTNYYGVAFAIAKYREIFKFEEGHTSTLLLNHLLDHIKQHSKDYGFMDETQGDGRFDRYSTLIPAEIAMHLYNFDLEIDPFIKKMLRTSCNIYLAMASSSGNGIGYGRSIGVYGDTAALEILSASVINKLVDQKEEEIIIAYALAIVRKYLTFWSDPELEGINMWEKGRVTDSYRFKNRILGENLSTAMQVLTSIDHLQTSPYAQKGFSAEDIETILNFEDKVDIFEFAPSRCLYVIRKNKQVFFLPLINGGHNYYQLAPYLPVLQGSLFEMPVDKVEPMFYPFFTLENEQVIAPLVNYQILKMEKDCFEFKVEPFIKIKDGLKKIDLSDTSNHKEIENVEHYSCTCTYTIEEKFIKFSCNYTGENIKKINLKVGLFDELYAFSSTSVSSDRVKITGDNIIFNYLLDEEPYKTNHGQLVHLIMINVVDIKKGQFWFKIELGEENG